MSNLIETIAGVGITFVVPAPVSASSSSSSSRSSSSSSASAQAQPAGLSGFPTSPNSMQVVIGTRWTGAVAFVEDEVINLTQVGTSNVWTENGTNPLNATTNRLKMVFSNSGTIDTATVKAYNDQSTIEPSNPAIVFKKTGDTLYTFKEVWSLNPAGSSTYSYFFTPSPVTAYQTQVFKSITFI